MLHALLLASLSAIGQPDLAKLPPPTGDRIVPRGAKLEHLFTRTAPIKGGLTEGPAAAPDGTIYFSDIPFGEDRGMILRFDPRTRKTTVFTADSKKANGLTFDAKGFLIACEGADHGGRCVSRWNVQTGERTVLADKYMGKRFNSPNDLVLDAKGRIYFTDPRYVGAEPRELKKEAVYRLDPDGTVTEATTAVEKPNGIGISPDGKTLYVADHNSGSDRVDVKGAKPKPGAMKIYAFPLGADGKVAGPRRTLVDFGKEAGCDGMTLDEQGNVYLTVRSPRRPGVLVVDPAGKEVAFIPTGPSQPGAAEAVGRPSNVEFGVGAESNVLYVTVDKGLYRIRLKVNGHRLPAGK
ncbi:MAG: SMP-30/gluconolactonase/LRE family protein [Gemmataceae bacterium]|nr:SMP-30/gluconolactonase/LRE family protein [Gemmataceae bacterium]